MADLEEWLIFAQVRDSIRENPSLKNLLDSYARLQALEIKLLDLKKLLAEVCFLIAAESKIKKSDEVYFYANKSINIYRQLKIQELEEAYPILSELLPDLMHEDVVRQRIMEDA